MIRALLMAIVVLAAALFAQPNRTCLIVEMDGVKADGADIKVCLFDRPDGFPLDTALARTSARCNADAETVSIQFCDLPHGSYAVGLHHDQNGNNKMDSNWMHIPKEGYGLSTNFVPRFGKPKFKSCDFPVRQDTVRISIKMRY